MNERVWVVVAIAVVGCQGPEAFRARFDAGVISGGAGASGGGGAGILSIMTGAAGTAGAAGTGGLPVIGGASAGDGGASGAGGGAVVTGVAGTGPGTGGVAGAGVAAGTTGGAGAGAGTSNTSVDAGSGRDAGSIVIDAAPEAPPSVAYGSTTWKATASITAAGNADLPPNAFDGDLATRWTTGRNQTGDESFTIDLGTVQPVSRVVLDDTTNPQDFPAAYTIEVSSDGTKFTAVKMGRGETVTDVGFPRVNARYVRIRQTGTTPAGGSWWSIDELRIYS